MAKSKTAAKDAAPEAMPPDVSPSDALAPDPDEISAGLVSPVPPGAEIEEIEFLNERIAVTYATQTPEGVERIRRESPAVPHPDFNAARKALVAVLLDLCEIPARVANRVEVRGVAFKRSKAESRGAVVKGVRTYAESLGSMPLNSPVKFEEDAQKQRTFSASDWRKILVLQNEAEAFLNGKGAQASLFDQPTDEAATPEAGAAGGDGAGTADDVAAPDATADLAAESTSTDTTPAEPAESDADFDDGGKGLAKTVGRRNS